jgi:hypothetical protein
VLFKLTRSAVRLWYARQATANGWSRSMLEHWIESDLYSRQGRALTNFQTALPGRTAFHLRSDEKSSLAAQFSQVPIGGGYAFCPHKWRRARPCSPRGGRLGACRESATHFGEGAPTDSRSSPSKTPPVCVSIDRLPRGKIRWWPWRVFALTMWKYSLPQPLRRFRRKCARLAELGSRLSSATVQRAIPRRANPPHLSTRSNCFRSVCMASTCEETITLRMDTLLYVTAATLIVTGLVGAIVPPLPTNSTMPGLLSSAAGSIVRRAAKCRPS